MFERPKTHPQKESMLVILNKKLKSLQNNLLYHKKQQQQVSSLPLGELIAIHEITTSTIKQIEEEIKITEETPTITLQEKRKKENTLTKLKQKLRSLNDPLKGLFNRLRPQPPIPTVVPLSVTPISAPQPIRSPVLQQSILSPVSQQVAPIPVSQQVAPTPVTSGISTITFDSGAFNNEIKDDNKSLVFMINYYVKNQLFIECIKFIEKNQVQKGGSDKVSNVSKEVFSNIVKKIKLHHYVHTLIAYNYIKKIIGPELVKQYETISKIHKHINIESLVTDVTLGDINGHLINAYFVRPDIPDIPVSVGDIVDLKVHTSNLQKEFKETILFSSNTYTEINTLQEYIRTQHQNASQEILNKINKI